MDRNGKGGNAFTDKISIIWSLLLNQKCIKLQCWFPHFPPFFFSSHSVWGYWYYEVVHVVTFRIIETSVLFLYVSLWFSVSGLVSDSVYVFAKSQFWCTFHLVIICSFYDDFDSFSTCEHNFNVHTSYIDIICITPYTIVA